MPFGRSFAVALVIVLAASSRAAADDEGPWDANAEAAALVARLKSCDAKVRDAAAAEVVAGWGHHFEAVARALADAGDEAWTSFAAACTSKVGTWAAVPLMASARSGPEPHRKRLVALARRLDPERGTELTQDAALARVRDVFDGGDRWCCGTGCYMRFAQLGHVAVPAIVSELRARGPASTLSGIAASSLAWTAEKEDVPALRELLVAGHDEIARALAALAAHGVSEAADALLDAVEGGRLDDDLAAALVTTRDRRRTLKTVRAWVAKQPQVLSETKVTVAKLYAELAALDTVSDVETWLTAATKPREFIAFGEALTRLGSRKGVETLVRIVGEKLDVTYPTDPSPLVVPPPGGDRMCLHGFDVDERWRAAEGLDAVAGRAVFPRADPVASPDKRRDESAEARLDRAAAAYRDWWTATKDKLTFDASLRVWIGGR